MMDQGNSFVKPESPSDTPFDVKGFKNLLDSLKESKRQQLTKAKPNLNTEQITD